MRFLALRAAAAPSCREDPTNLKGSSGWSSHIARRTDGMMTGLNFGFAKIGFSSDDGTGEVSYPLASKVLPVEHISQADF